MKARIEIVPNGVDSTHFRPDGRSGDREALADRLKLDGQTRIVLLAATNFQLKGLDTAIKVLSRMHEAVLVVAGGDNPSPYESLAHQAGVADRVHFLQC